MAALHTILVEGNIGAGKTTLCNKLKEIADMSIVSEPVSDNTLLASFYADPSRYAFPLQMFMLGQRMATWATSPGREDGPPVVHDGSLLRDLVFARENHADGVIDDDKFEVYMAARGRAFAPREGAVIVYLDVTPEECAKRARARGRPFEKEISLAYLRGLNRQYEFALGEARSNGWPVVRIYAQGFADPNLVLAQAAEESLLSKKSVQ